MKKKYSLNEKIMFSLPITLCIVSLLMLVETIAKHEIEFTFIAIIIMFCAFLTLYAVKNHCFKKLNAGFVVGMVMLQIGYILMTVLMMLSCQIPDFVMHLYRAGMAIAFLSYLYGAIKARK